MASYDYSKANVEGLITAITNLKNNLNFESLSNASDKLSGDAYWISEQSKDHFLTGLNKNLEFLNNFKNSLGKALEVCGYIKSWQYTNDAKNSESQIMAFCDTKIKEYSNAFGLPKLGKEYEYTHYFSQKSQHEVAYYDYIKELEKLEKKIEPLLPFKV